MRGTQWLVLIVVVGAALATGVGLSQRRQVAEQPAITGLLWPDPKTLAPFSLADHDGRVFDLARLRGRWSFLFFGFTSCPDMCPTTMAQLGGAADLLSAELGSEAECQFVLISVDPERDSPERLEAYVEHFNPAFLGVTGQPERLDALRRQLGIMRAVVGDPAAGDYTVDHSASVLLIDPDARLVGIFSAPHEARTIADRAARIIRFVQSSS
jgi:protein SCO1/2